jgi:hypothetical protein
MPRYVLVRGCYRRARLGLAAGKRCGVHGIRGGGAWLDLADFNRGQARQYHRRRLTAAIEAGVAALDDARLLAH